MAIAGQKGRVTEAILSKWASLKAAGLARGAAGNYFSRGDEEFDLEPEAALWLERETGYRAAGMMFGELPRRLDATVAIVEEAIQEGRRIAIEQAIDALRAISGPSTATVVATSPGAATVSPEQHDQEVAGEQESAGKKPTGRRKQA